MSGLASKSEIKMSLEAGARGFIPKTMAGKAFVDAISIVIDGEKFIGSFSKRVGKLNSYTQTLR